MSTLSSDHLSWWDREIDSTGRPLRPDVRAAAHQIWADACQQAKVALGEPCEAAILLEKAAAQISRYLDGRGAGLMPSDVPGLLMCAFVRGLRRHVRKLSRIEFVGDVTQLSLAHACSTATTEVDYRLDAKKAASQLTARGRGMYELRKQGYDWNEIGKMLKISPAQARAEYSRELKRARSKINRKAAPTVTRPRDGEKL